MDTLVIGLGYKARHGKNFVATELVRYAGSRGLYAKDYGFADALKAVARVQFGMKEKDGPLLQVLGTDVFRRQNQNVWVDALMYRIRDDKPDVAIITDMRFENEVAAVKAMGGIAVRVQRWNGRHLWSSPDRDPTHSSECALDGFTGWNAYLDAQSGAQESLATEARAMFDTFLKTAVDGGCPGGCK